MDKATFVHVDRSLKISPKPRGAGRAHHKGYSAVSLELCCQAAKCDFKIPLTSPPASSQLIQPQHRTLSPNNQQPSPSQTQPYSPDLRYRMPSPHLNLQSLHPANLKNIPAGLGNLVNERGFNQQVITGLMTNAKKLLEFLKQPSESGVKAAPTQRG